MPCVSATSHGVGRVATMDPISRATRGRNANQLLDAFLPPDDGLYFYYPSRAPLAETLRVFADFLRGRLNAPPQP